MKYLYLLSQNYKIKSKFIFATKKGFFTCSLFIENMQHNSAVRISPLTWFNGTDDFINRPSDIGAYLLSLWVGTYSPIALCVSKDEINGFLST